MPQITFDEVSEVFQFPTLHKHQQEFATTHAMYPLSIGAQGSGKSLGGICRALFMSINTPFFGDMTGNKGIIGRQSRQDLIATTMRDFLEIIPEAWIATEPKAPKWTLTLRNKSEISFVPMEDLGRFKSFNLGWAFFEEIDETDEDVWEEVAFNRLRRIESLIGGPINFHSAFQVCNPTMNWVFDIWGKNEERLTSKNILERKKYNPHFLTLHSSTYDNAANLPPEFIPAREKRFGGPNSRKGKMYLLGEWGGHEGAVYPWREELVNDTDIWPPIEHPTLVGLDHAWGAGGQTAFDFISLNERPGERTKLTVYDSLTLSKVDIATAVEELDNRLQFHAIKRAEASNLPTAPLRIKPLMLVYDPAMKGTLQRTTKGQKEISIIEIYNLRAMERGFSLPIVAGNNQITVGVDRLEWLMVNDLIRWNPRTIESYTQVKNYVWDKKREGKPKEHQVDHHCDDIRYVVMSLDTLKHFPTGDEKETNVDRIMARLRVVQATEERDYDLAFYG